MSEDNNNSPNEIPLKKQPDIVKSAFYYPDRNRAKISLNGMVNADIVFTPDKKWQNNIKMVMEQAQAYGYGNDTHKSIFYRFLNENEDILVPAAGDIGDNGDNMHKKVQEEAIKSAAETIVKLVLENGKLFKNTFEEPHALVVIDNHYVPLLVGGSKFEHHLAKLFYDKCEKRIANAESINNAVRTLAATAIFEGETIPLHLKLAWANPETRDAIYYDLSDKNRRCIKITKGKGWEIVENQIEVLFKMSGHQSPQVEPIRDYYSSVFRKFIDSLNIKNPKHKLLIAVWIISSLIPDISIPILLPYGEKGGAKSTLLKKIQLVIAPTTLDLFSVPYRKEEFIQQLSHNFLCFYDNVRYEPKWLSDEACRANTGAASTKRKLYSDDEDIPYKYKKIQAYSGINVIFTQEDALDRSLKIELERIQDDVTITDTKIADEVRGQVPHLLGYIFDVLAKALEIKDSIKLERLPRMADFAEWGEAIARAMGYKPLQFLNAYFENIKKQNIEIVESNPFAEAISKFQDYNVMSWISSPQIFIQNLTYFADTNSIDSSKFPKNPNTVSRRLNKIKSNLREGLGIEIKVERVGACKGNEKFVNTAVIKIRTISPLSPETPLSPGNEGQEQAQAREKEDKTEFSGDNGDNGDIMRKKIGNPELFKCNFCESGFPTIDKHIEHFKFNHEGLPSRPSIREIEEMKEKGIHIEEKGNAWE
jgi:hypothetical protein